jgi:hypothetical protein
MIRTYIDAQGNTWRHNGYEWVLSRPTLLELAVRAVQYETERQ